MRRIGFVVVGRVQGVAFRAHAEAAARRFELVGFVRNRADGAVHGEAQGAALAVDQWVQWLHTGSPWSRVDEVQIVELAAAPGEVAFVVRR